MTEPLRRPGTRFIAKLLPGEQFLFLPDGSIAITHPDRPPRIIPPLDPGQNTDPSENA